MIFELKTFLIAMLPIIELRVAIPIALQVYHLPILLSFFLSVVGNFIPVIFLVLIFKPISEYLSRNFHFFNKFFTWFFKKAERNHYKKFERWKELALIILVAIPLPFTGAWTGSICAFIFRIPVKTALPLIFIGILIAGLIVTVLTLGIFQFI